MERRKFLQNAGIAGILATGAAPAVHARQAYTLTGPEALTSRQLAALAPGGQRRQGEPAVVELLQARDALAGVAQKRVVLDVLDGDANRRLVELLGASINGLCRTTPNAKCAADPKSEPSDPVKVGAVPPFDWMAARTRSRSSSTMWSIQRRLWLLCASLLRPSSRSMPPSHCMRPLARSQSHTPMPPATFARRRRSFTRSTSARR